MGCTQSKIDQDEAITRCKDRKYSLAHAVSSRNAFAAAHSSYAVSLKNTGAALSDYAHAEIPLDSSSTSASSNLPPSSSSSSHPVPANLPPPMETLPPPPPPLPADLPPLQRSVSMPDIPLPQPVKKPMAEPAIREEEDEEADDENDGDDDDDDEDDSEEEEEEESLSKTRRHHHHQPLRRSEPISTVTITASPPRPPPALPVQLQPPKTTEPSIPAANLPPPMTNPEGGWDYFIFGPDTTNPPTLSQPEPEEQHPWQEPPKPVKIEEEKIEKPTTLPPPKVVPEVVEMPVEPPVKPPKQVKKAMPSTASSSGSNTGGGVPVHHQHTVSAGPGLMPVDSSKRGRIVPVTGPTISSSNLLKAIDHLDDHFLRAYESAGDVSKMLEAARMHYHSNFVGSRGHINHSDKIMRVITWNRSFKGLPQQENMDDKFETEEPETHATILDKLLAWEKKLYEEVKAGEVMKIEYQRKVALLNKQKKKGVRTEVLEKTKAAVSHLHTRYIVDMQSMDSTVSEIKHLRDDLLYPKLVELVNGMARMWRSMYEHHRQQYKIIYDNREAAYEIPLPPRETTEDHFKQTSQLHNTVKELHIQLQKLIEHQKDYVKNLNDWVKLSIIPIESSLKEKVSSPPRQSETPIKYLLHSWNDHIGKLPLELAKTAILSFSEVVNTILVLQTDELMAKRRYEHTDRELDKKKRQFGDSYRKYMEKRASLAEETGAEVGDNQAQDPFADRRIQIEQLEIRLKDEHENHRRLCKQVREKSIASLRTHLPELFRSMSEFARAASEMYKSLPSSVQRIEVLD